MAKEWLVAIITTAIALILGGVIAFLIQSPVEEAMTNPKAFPIAQYNEKVCPETLSFRTLERVAPFSIKIQNIGDDGMLTCKIFSDNLLNRKSDVDEFKEESMKEIFAAGKESKDFFFELKPKKSLTGLERFRITLSYSCYEEIITGTFSCDEKKICCNYEKKGRTNFLLVNQSC